MESPLSIALLEVLALKEYVLKAGKALRLGYTTGSCATLAAKAAATMLLTGKRIDESTILTPRGIPLTIPVEDVSFEEESVRCAVRKDAGDDPDVTDGILIYAIVSKTHNGRIAIDGGRGVGRVTRQGLDQPVGTASINRVPRQMIDRELESLRKAYAYTGGFSVVIEIPRGEELAAKTFNPQLGIVGGLSVIGTTGIVDPMSSQALLDTIDTELKMHQAEGTKEILLTPGNYGEAFLAENPAFAQRPVVKCSNYIGQALDMAVQRGFTSVLLVGHIGKLVKIAGGIMDTHSYVADCRMELLALHCALGGGDISLFKAVLACMTTDEALSHIEQAGLKKPVLASLVQKMDDYLQRRVRGALATGVIPFSFRFGILGISAGGQAILEKWEKGG